jgi:putative DNA primase/helicase
VHFVEGEKKALAVAQLGLLAVGIAGVGCWRKKYSNDVLPEIENVVFMGKPAYIHFDSDPPDNERARAQVDSERRKLAAALRDAGASEVFMVEIPLGPDGEKQGADDYIVREGKDAYLELVKNAQPVPPVDSPSLKSPQGRTDTANAKRLAAKFGHLFRWCGALKCFLIWDGKRWCAGDNVQMEAFAKRIAAQLWKDINQLRQENVEEDEQKAKDETIRMAVGFAIATNKGRAIREMVSLVRSEPGVAVEASELDKDEYLLNVENGTLDLRTGDLMEHDPDDHITKLARVKFDAAATCPRWIKFIDRILGSNTSLIKYLQMLVGISLTGSQDEQMFPFLHGDGDNGKSTFLQVLMKMLGEYACKGAPELLTVKRSDAHPTERADLQGKRFVACIETEDGRRLATALVKELTGGDTMSGRGMYENHRNWDPTHHIWLASNHKPAISDRSHGTFRRIKLIPFEVKIPEQEKDKKLKQKLIAELPGILNWAIAGCLEWQQSGLEDPTKVVEAVETYKAETDFVGQFLDTCCVRDDKLMIPANDLYQAFRAAMPDCEMTRPAFGAELRKRGIADGKITTGAKKGSIGWKGLRLISK